MAYAPVVYTTCLVLRGPKLIPAPTVCRLRLLTVPSSLSHPVAKEIVVDRNAPVIDRNASTIDRNACIIESTSVLNN